MVQLKGLVKMGVAVSTHDRIVTLPVGVGSTLHLAGELFEDFAGAPMTHVAYKGSVPAITDVVGGRVELMFDVDHGAAARAVGRLRAIAVLRRPPVVPA
jgi:tripartite-type tricarboxylate transporter receptor subunit TctC